VAKFKYFEITVTGVTNQNCIHEGIKSRLNSEKVYYHAVQNVWSSRSMSENVKIKIYKTIILRILLYGCETWFLTLRKEHRLRVLENRVLRIIFKRKSDEVTD
jgi:hypothetical protein